MNFETLADVFIGITGRDRQAAGHIAGIRHYNGNEFLSSEYYETVLEGLTIFQDDDLLFEPGTRYAASAGVLQKIRKQENQRKAAGSPMRAS